MSKHDCVRRINEQLKPHNTALAGAICFSEPERELIQVATVKADQKMRVKPRLMFASFCPFCGVNLRSGERVAGDVAAGVAS